jgi:hypothetical protein
MKLFINIYMQKKSLEDTIRNLHKKYKNVPSPLSENYNHMNSNIHMAPQQTTPSSDVRSQLLSGFKPPKASKVF